MPVTGDQYRRGKIAGAREPPPCEGMSFCPKLNSGYTWVARSVIRFHTYAGIRMRSAAIHAFCAHPRQRASRPRESLHRSMSPPYHKKTGTQRAPVKRSSFCPKSCTAKCRPVFASLPCDVARTQEVQPRSPGKSRIRPRDAIHRPHGPRRPPARDHHAPQPARRRKGPGCRGPASPPAAVHR